MNKGEKRINNKCNFIDNLLLDNGLYKGVSALVEIEEHISNLYDEIDEYKKRLEEKDKVIDKAINYAKNTTVAEHGSEEIFNISELWFVKELLEILERGKK